MSDDYSDDCNCGGCRAVRVTNSINSMGRDLKDSESLRNLAVVLLDEAKELIEKPNKLRFGMWKRNVISLKESTND